MTEPSCLGCRDRDALIAALRQAVERLEARVKDLEARRPEVERLLVRGLQSGCAKTAETCCHLLEAEEALWTFARVEGVEPTNNAAERALRGAVIWRKKCFGSQSEAGCEFVGRLLSVVGTLRKQGRRVLDYLTDAIKAHSHALPAPAILPSL